MKNFKYYFVILLLAAAVSCKKNDSSSVNIKGNVSNDEAADMVAASVSTNLNGVAGVSGDVTVSAQAFVGLHLPCGTSKSDSVSRQSTGTNVSYSYKLKYSYMLNCNSDNQPDNLVSNLAYSGTYSGPHISSSNSGSSAFIVGGLSPSATAYVINGEYKRDGSFKSKVDTTNAGSSSIDIAVKSLTLSKPDRKIASGSATFTITGNVPKKGNFNYNGSIVFNGDGTANLTVNGTVYVVVLATGEKSKK
ncbi:MAG: hypothetical protein M3O71_02125 [Bacteroidota bacterium]|nr:hypothetical protein [Bacteroidota bacterium]